MAAVMIGNKATAAAVADSWPHTVAEAALMVAQYHNKHCPKGPGATRLAEPHQEHSAPPLMRCPCMLHWRQGDAYNSGKGTATAATA